MALLRCPNCRARGEVIIDDPQQRVRCSVCGHGFVAGEADSTHEYNILSEDSPLFLPEAVLNTEDWSIPTRWRDWVEGLAAHCGVEPAESVRLALAEYARAREFTVPPPSG